MENYDALRAHAHSPIFEAKEIHQLKSKIAPFHGKILKQESLTQTEITELGKLLNSALKSKDKNYSSEEIIKQFKAELLTPNAPFESKTLSAIRPVFAQSHGKLTAKAIPATITSGNLRLQKMNDAKYDIYILKISDVTKDDRVPSRVLENDEQIEFVIKDKDGNLKKVTVDVEEMADKFLIKKEKLLKAAKEGTLPQFLAAKREYFEALPRIMESYSKLFDSYAALKQDSSIASQSKVLTAEQLMKVVKSYYKADVGGILPFGKKKAWREGKAVLIKMQGMEFWAKTEEGQLLLARTDKRKFLGAGTFGKAFRIDQLDAGKQMVQKKASPRFFFLYFWAKADLKNEFKMLREIHKDGIIPGIQEPPHAFYKITGLLDKVSFVGQKYDGDVADLVSDELFINDQIDRALLNKCCQDILSAGAKLHQRNIVHGDNKPANTFFRMTREAGQITDLKVFLADFGGARKLEDIKNFRSGVTTSVYDPPGDRQWRREARKSGDKEEFAKALKARDVYQRGVILYQLLAGDHQPWELKSGSGPKHPPEYPDAQFNAAPLHARGISEPMIQQLEAMLHPDPKKRPDAQTALASWNALGGSSQ